MKKLNYAIAVLSLTGLLAGCNAGVADESSSGELTETFQPAPKITIPSGTRFRISLIDGVSTDGSSAGDRFEGSLADPVMVEGKPVLAKGTKVRGRVADVKESGRVKGVASIRLILTNVVHDGEDLEISTKPFVAEAETTKKRDTGIIAGGAGAGAIIGAVAGGKKGAGMGALIGGGAGTGAVLATKGKELHYPPETRLNFTLDKPLML